MPQARLVLYGPCRPSGDAINSATVNGVVDPKSWLLAERSWRAVAARTRVLCCAVNEATREGRTHRAAYHVATVE